LSCPKDRLRVQKRKGGEKRILRGEGEKKMKEENILSSSL